MSVNSNISQYEYQCQPMLIQMNLNISQCQQISKSVNIQNLIISINVNKYYLMSMSTNINTN